MVDVNGKSKFQPLLQAVENNRRSALKSASTIWGRAVSVFQDSKPTIPFIELSILLGILVLAFS